MNARTVTDDELDKLYLEHFVQVAGFPRQCACGAVVRYAQLAPSMIGPTSLPWVRYVVYACGADFQWSTAGGVVVTTECPERRPFCIMCGQARRMKGGGSLFCGAICGLRWADARIRADELKTAEGKPTS